jgi:hypothetical protein
MLEQYTLPKNIVRIIININPIADKPAMRKNFIIEGTNWRNVK